MDISTRIHKVQVSLAFLFFPTFSEKCWYCYQIVGTHQFTQLRNLKTIPISFIPCICQCSADTSFITSCICQIGSLFPILYFTLVTLVPHHVTGFPHSHLSHYIQPSPAHIHTRTHTPQLQAKMVFQNKILTILLLHLKLHLK